MSGAPKRLHDEESYSTTLKRSSDEGCMSSNIPGKLIQPVINERRMPFGSAPDGRAAKVQRLEPRDFDKRSSHLPMHKMSFPADGSCLNDLIAAENRSEHKGSQDNRDAKIEVRETSVEARKSYTDVKINAQVSKTENNIRKESEDKKGLISDLSHSDYRTDIRLKDGNTASVSHLNRKEPKEHHRGQRCTESPKDGLDSWCAVRYGSRNMCESAKDISTCQEQEALEAHEALVENKLDLKWEEKLKDKERQKKDEKHRDGGERDMEVSELCNKLQRCDTSNQCKDYMREDKERERLDRRKKDAQKDKERNDGDKDHVKRELSNINGKDSFHSEGALEGHVRIPEKEGTTLELKRHKELSSWKFSERDTDGKKRDRESDKDAHKHEKHWSHEKESEDGCAGLTERGREAFGYGIQQRRRMVRSRGTPQSSNQEPHFHSRARENEGSQAGESEASAITYKVGECMQELLKLWKEFEASLGGKIDEGLQNGPTLEIQIPAEHVTATNPQVRVAQLWGTDIYTNDSDLVAVLMHTGYCRLAASLPPPAVQELRTIVRVLPPQNCYYSTLRNNVRSRSWGAGIGCSFCVESCYVVKKGGGNIDLEPRLTLISAQEPTLAPMPVERTITTRAAATNALKHQRFVREVSVQYNLCNEPWAKYSMNVVADRGLKKPFYTSARLKKGEVLYLETHSNRYELCFSGEKVVENGTMLKSTRQSESGHEKAPSHISHVQTVDRNQEYDSTVDVFRWSRCTKPLSQKVMLSIGIPLPLGHVEVLQENLDWEDVQWSQTGVWVAGRAYDLVRAHFLSPC